MNHAEFRVVRLNAKLFPVGAFEADLYRQHGLSPVEVEANSSADITRLTQGCDALFVVSTALPETVVEALERCRVISRLGAGTDKIAVEVATRMGVLVTNVPNFCVEEQADHTMAMLLGLVRKLPQMTRAMADGAFNLGQTLARGNQRLSGRTLGLVGFGRSARAVASRARGFGLRVIATRRDLAADPVAAKALGVEMTDLETVLLNSDFLSLHLPLTAETRHMIDGHALARMKAGAILINTSRGALVDEVALEAAVRQGHLAGAGLDTFEHIDVFTAGIAQPPHPMRDLENVLLTPHVAAGSVQAGEDVARGGIGNVVAVLGGHWPPRENVVNPTVVPKFSLQRHGPATVSG